MTILTTAEKLAEARTALHALMTGQQAVAFRHEGRQVQYNIQQADELRKYIRELEATLAEELGTTSSTGRRPFGVVW